jgi:uncharacterized membrane protein YecN with MAPEG domain
MHASWHLALIAVLFVVGVYLYYTGQNADPLKQQDSKRRRVGAYVLWTIAVLLAVHCYWLEKQYNHVQSKARMWHARAQMCGQSAQMCGGGDY